MDPAWLRLYLEKFFVRHRRISAPADRPVFVIGQVFVAVGVGGAVGVLAGVAPTLLPGTGPSHD